MSDTLAVIEAAGFEIERYRRLTVAPCIVTAPVASTSCRTPSGVTLLAIPFGLVIGLIVGAVGGGGAILALPVLVYVLGDRSARHRRPR